MARIIFPGPPDLHVVGADETLPSEAVEVPEVVAAPPPAPPAPVELKLVPKQYGQPYEPYVPPRWMDTIQDTFPDEGIIHSYCWWAAQSTDAPGRFHLGSILPILCYELTRQGFSFSFGGETVYPTWWACLVGPSGCGKSTAIQFAKSFATDYWEGGNMSPFKDPFVQMNGSPEGIQHKLATEHFNTENEATEAILFREEFAQVLDHKSIPEMLCELIDGRALVPQTRHRQKQIAAGEASQESAGGILRRPRCSGVFSSTREALAAVVTDQHLQGGAFSRIHWLSEKYEDPTRMQGLQRRFPYERSTALGTWTTWAGSLAGCKLSGQDKVVYLSDEVKEIAVQQLFDPYKRQLAGEHILNGARRRAVQHAYMLSCIYAISQLQFTVRPEDMYRAILYVEKDLAALQTLTEKLSTDEARQDMDIVLEFLGRQRTQLTKPQILRSFRIPPSRIGKALDALLESEQLRKVSTLRTGRPGRPAVLYEVSQHGVRSLQTRHLPVSDTHLADPTEDELDIDVEVELEGDMSPPKPLLPTRRVSARAVSKKPPV